MKVSEWLAIAILALLVSVRAAQAQTALIQPWDTDLTVASGNDYEVGVGNGSLFVWTGTTETLDSPATNSQLNDIYCNPSNPTTGNGLPNACSGGPNLLGDSRIKYDPTHSRWIAVALVTSEQEFMIAASTGADPMGTWYSYEISTPGYNDKPKLGIGTTTALVDMAGPGSSPMWQFQLAALESGAALVNNSNIVNLPGTPYAALSSINGTPTDNAIYAVRPATLVNGAVSFVVDKYYGVGSYILDWLSLTTSTGYTGNEYLFDMPSDGPLSTSIEHGASFEMPTAQLAMLGNHPSIVFSTNMRTGSAASTTQMMIAEINTSTGAGQWISRQLTIGGNSVEDMQNSVAIQPGTTTIDFSAEVSSVNYFPSIVHGTWTPGGGISWSTYLTGSDVPDDYSVIPNWPALVPLDRWLDWTDCGDWNNGLFISCGHVAAPLSGKNEEEVISYWLKTNWDRLSDDDKARGYDALTSLQKQDLADRL